MHTDIHQTHSLPKTTTRRHTLLIASSAARPCSTTGTVTTGAGTASVAKLRRGVGYTCGHSASRGGGADVTLPLLINAVVQKTRSKGQRNLCAS
jgi:hypothetical protein